MEIRTLIKMPCALTILLALAVLPRGLRAQPVDHVIHITVDGLPGDVLNLLINDSPGFLPNFTRLVGEGASTYNARTDYFNTQTIPNHASILTGRPVLQPDGQPDTVHHGFANNFPGLGDTLHDEGNPNLPYVASVFDVAHDRGLSTAMFASKSKFVLFDQSYNEVGGAPDTDPVGGNNGRNKIDVSVIDTNTSRLVNSFISSMNATPRNYSFLHLRDPDSYGHSFGWGSAQFANAIQGVDTFLGTVLNLVETHPALAGSTAIVLTADHGGTAFGHGNPANLSEFKVPFLVWGPGIGNADLYDVYSDTRLNPGDGRPDYNAPLQPIRNGDSSNLALSLLGLPPIPGSSMILASALGDMNLDGTVDRADAVLLLGNLGRSGEVTLADGNLDGDNGVTLADLAILQANLSQTFASPPVGQTAVPEPSSRALLALALAGLCFAARCRQKVTGEKERRIPKVPAADGPKVLY